MTDPLTLFYFQKTYRGIDGNKSCFSKGLFNLVCPEREQILSSKVSDIRLSFSEDYLISI